MARKHGEDRGLFERPKASGVWWIRWAGADGREHIKKVGPKAKAQKAYLRVKGDILAGRVTPWVEPRRVPLLSECIADYLRHNDEKVSARQDKLYGKMWGELYGTVAVNAITAKMVEQYKLIWAQDKSARTVNNRLQFLRRVINIAIRDGHATRNPVTGAGLLRENCARDRWLTEDEEARLKRVFDPWWWCMVIFAMYTGMRQGNQWMLTWDRVDLDRRTIVIPRGKHGKKEYVKISDHLVPVLEELRGRNLGKYVFCGREGGRTLRNFLGREWEPALAAAGIEDFCWHDLRHTVASRLKERGVDIYTIKQVLGHQSVKTTERYTHVGAGVVLDALNLLKPAIVTETVTERR